MYVRYNYRIYPTEEQKQQIHKTCGAVRWIYNNFLAFEIACYKATQKFIFFENNCLTLTKIKNNISWLNIVNSNALQQELRILNQAMKRYFEGTSEFPVFKKKKPNSGSYQLCPGGNKIRILDHNTVQIPNLGPTKIKLHRRVPGKTGTTTIIWDGDKYYASFVVEVPDNPDLIRNIPKSNAVGIDAGLSSFLTTSDGEVINNPRFMKKSNRRLKIRQRRVSRKKLGSKNREKAQKQVKNIHGKVKNQRKEFHYKIANDLVKNYDLLCFENLSLKGLMKTKLAKSFSDVGLAQFLEITKWIAKKHGKVVVQIGRFEPSTKTCNNCGHKQEMPLDQRIFDCESCGHKDDRDHNAAMNILDWGYIRYTAGTAEIYDQKAKPKGMVLRSRKTKKKAISESNDLSGKSSLEQSSFEETY